jgi:1,4-dihydroxy-2-naphthoate octaprenyltransferase
MVVYACSYLLCALCLLVVIIVVASCWLSGGDVESSVSVPFYTRAHTLNKKKKKKKKFAPVIRVVVVTRRFVTYGIRARFDPRLGIRYGFR